MATKNSINNKSGSLTLDPGASGDSFLQFNINSTGEFRIGVDDTDDSFRISQGSALGTNDTFIMDVNGIRLAPLLPAFLALNSSTRTNVTGDSTAYTMVFDTEKFDLNNDFATPTFTAPVTARYAFNIQFLLKGIGGSHSAGTCSLVTSNRTYLVHMGDPSVYVGGDNFTYSTSFIADMDVSDTATVSLVVSGSTKSVDFFGGGTNNGWSVFSGYLLC